MIGYFCKKEQNNILNFKGRFNCRFTILDLGLNKSDKCQLVKQFKICNPKFTIYVDDQFNSYLNYYSAPQYEYPIFCRLGYHD